MSGIFITKVQVQPRVEGLKQKTELRTQDTGGGGKNDPTSFLGDYGGQAENDTTATKWRPKCDQTATNNDILTT
jgi:hypothetical protein